MQCDLSACNGIVEAASFSAYKSTCMVFSHMLLDSCWHADLVTANPHYFKGPLPSNGESIDNGRFLIKPGWVLKVPVVAGSMKQGYGVQQR